MINLNADLTLAEVRKRKAALDEAIRRAVQEFYDVTGIRVQYVSLGWATLAGTSRDISLATAEAEVKI